MIEYGENNDLNFKFNTTQKNINTLKSTPSYYIAYLINLL